MEKKKRTIIIFLGAAALIVVGLICLVKMQKSKLNILVVGDSIGAGAGASETDKKWFRLLEKDLESKDISVEIDNPSLGGNTSFAGFCMVEEADPEKNYDAYLIDTIAAFDESGIDYKLLSDDGVHPNDEGQNIYYEKAIAAVN